LYEFNVEENKCEKCECESDQWLDWDEEEDECKCRECSGNSYIKEDGTACVQCKFNERVGADGKSCELIPCEPD
jgi:hypothetical protein